MKPLLLLLLVAVSLLAACTAPPPASTPATEQPATGANLPEVTVFRPPT